MNKDHPHVILDMLDEPIRVGPFTMAVVAIFVVSTFIVGLVFDS